ncbi:MAG: S-methyl-5-thioribose-1-phosphate isomerase [Bacteroidales bacterium]|nr:S-methyl-5-thioribose-1-phosphate isomerase [Bacteroidales bacterium]
MSDHTTLGALRSLQVCSLAADGRVLRLLDQRMLPHAEQWVEVRTADEVAEAIRGMVVRGAPAIGVAAAYGLYVAMRNADLTTALFDPLFAHACQVVGTARPTAVNLRWAVQRMAHVGQQSAGLSTAERLQRLREEAEQIARYEADACTAIGQVGSTLITDGLGVLTHCNAGHLATSWLGTALAPIYTAWDAGRRFRVYADETRPQLQGARLTAYELHRAGVDVTLLCDGMAASLMQQGRIGLVLVGCDRVAANGDVANKIGTLSVAISAHHYGIPFYVCGPWSTFDPACPTGKDIPIEQRAADEVIRLHYHRPMAPDGIGVYNPAFDVTPAELITGYITDRGLLHTPLPIH